MDKYSAVGRRKRSVARVRLIPGQGKWLVNSKSPQEYFGRETLIKIVEQPLVVTDTVQKFNVVAEVDGGGISGQAGALQLAIARALTVYNSDCRAKLKKQALLTRDPREKERMKYGLAKRRKRYQYSKR